MSIAIKNTNHPDLVETGTAPFSSVVEDAHHVYLAGIVAADFAAGRACLGDVAAETAAIMDVVGQLLARHALTMADIVRCDVHLADLDDMPAMNAVYRTYFADGKYPARTTTQSGALYGGSRVEITCMARRP